jgi:hypothetical protein
MRLIGGQANSVSPTGDTGEEKAGDQAGLATNGHEWMCRVRQGIKDLVFLSAYDCVGRKRAEPTDN